jgi:hypothetical protein
MVMKTSVFWDIMPCSPLTVARRFAGTCRHQLQGHRISQEETSLKYGGKHSFSTSEIEAVRFSETPNDFQRTTKSYIPELSKTHHVYIHN